MLRHFRKWQVVVALLAIFVLSIGLLQAAPADAVVGDGTPASCDANALEAALAGGGDVTFNCGLAPLTIASTKWARGGGGTGGGKVGQIFRNQGVLF